MVVSLIRLFVAPISELRTQNLFIRPYTHLQNKVQCMNNNVYIMYILVKETPAKTK